MTSSEPKSTKSDADREWQSEREDWYRECRTDLTAWATEALAARGEAPAKHHVFLLQKLAAAARGEIDRLMVFMPPGSAKALALDTPIPTPSGWTTMGQLRTGDEVFDETGTPCRVIVVSDVFRNRPVYAVRTDSGDEIIADADHQWRVSLCRKPRLPLKLNGKGTPPRSDRDDPASRYKIKTTAELARKRTKRPMIEAARALILPEADLPLDPWVLGVWLGDGHSRDARVTAGVDDQPWIRRELEGCGHPTTTQPSSRITFGVADLRGRLGRLGLLMNKHIPPIYLRASISQRLALLQGLIDTDGTVSSEGHVTFVSTKRRLADDVLELVRTLGVKASITIGRAVLDGRDCGPAYKVSFFHPEAARLPRKRRKCRAGRRTPNTYIDVTPVGIADTVCIAVDSPSHLFLCGRSMTPTHNTTYTSVVFMCWMLAQREGMAVIAASYNSEYAEGVSYAVMAMIQEHAECLELEVVAGTRKLWYTSKRGLYRAAGAQSGITGRRADVVVIDDPMKGREDADNPGVRERIWAWYRAEVIPRLKPKAIVILVMTRWHNDDLAGRLLDAAQTGADQWTVIDLPALAEKDDQLGRKPGEALWPEWEDEEALQRKRIAVGEREWCTPAESPVLMADLTFKPISEVKEGDEVIGFAIHDSGGRKRFTKTRVTAVSSRVAPVVSFRMKSGYPVRCTREHRWYTRRIPTEADPNRKAYAPAHDGSVLRRVCVPALPELTDPEDIRAAGWLGGFFDGEGCISLSNRHRAAQRCAITFSQTAGSNLAICEKLEAVLAHFGFDFSMYEKQPSKDYWTQRRDYYLKGQQLQLAQKFIHIARPSKWRDRLIEGASRLEMKTEPDAVIDITEDGEELVYSLQTETGNYIVWGLASSNSALYQQKPSPSEGIMFKSHMIPIIDAAPPLSNIVRSWDLAGTEKRPGNNPDWTVGLKMGRTRDGAYVVLDVKRFRGAPDEVNSTIAATAIEDGKTVTIRLPEEAAAAGKQLKLAHARLLVGYRVVFERETGAKTTRADPVASQANVGNVSLLKGPWNLTLRDELAEFPYGSFDDQVDALSGAFGVVGLGKQPMQVSAEAVAATKARAGTVQQLTR